KVMSGKRAIITIELLERIADGCNMPDDVRVLLGLAPRGDALRRHRQQESAVPGDSLMLAGREASTVRIEPPIPLSAIAAVEPEIDDLEDLGNGARRIG